jgi:hypothetical protein
MQHLAMFSRLMIRSSLTMCSHEGLQPRLSDGTEKSTPQYTQCESRAVISRSSQSGIFHQFKL